MNLVFNSSRCVFEYFIMEETDMSLAEHLAEHLDIWKGFCRSKYK